MGPLLALRKALYSTFAGDAALIGVLGGIKIYADVPAATLPPYITFGLARVTRWTGGSSSGHAHVVTLDVWSLQKGDSEILAIAERLAQIIAATVWRLDGYRVLQCVVQMMTCHAPRSDGWRQVSLELSAYTEPVN